MGFHLSINFVFSEGCISHQGCEKDSNLWCTNKWKMDLQVKKLKVDIAHTPSKSSLAGPYHDPQDRDKLSISPSDERGLRKLILKCIALKVTSATKLFFAIK